MTANRFFLWLMAIVGSCAILACSEMPDSSHDSRKGWNKEVVVVHSFRADDYDCSEFNATLESKVFEAGIKAKFKHLYLSAGVNAFEEALFDVEDNHCDLLIVEGDYAVWTMASKYLSDPRILNVPIVVGGASLRDWSVLDSKYNICGWKTDIDLAENIRLAASISGCHNVAIELDWTEWDLFLRSKLKEAIDDNSFIDNMDLHIQRVSPLVQKKAMKDSIVVSVYSANNPVSNKKYASESSDRAKARYHDVLLHCNSFAHLSVKNDYLSNSVINLCDKPQFSCSRYGVLRNGGHILCGYFPSATTIADDLASSAVALLNGASPLSLPWHFHQNDYHMNWQAMRFWNLDYDDCCDKFSIIGAPFYVVHKFAAIALGICGLGLLVALVSFFSLVVSKRANRTKSLIIEEMNREVSASNIALMETDAALWSFTNGGFEFEADFCSRHGFPIGVIHIDNLSKRLSADGQKAMATFAASLSTVGAHRIQFHSSLCADEEEHWWQLRYEVSSEHQEVYGLLVNVDADVEREKEILMTQEMVEATENKEVFINNLSHEIRTPLNSILGFTTLLSAPPADISEADYDLFSSIISQNAKTLMDIVSGILDLSKIESGKMKFVNSTVSVSSFVHDVFEKYQAENSLRAPLVFSPGRNDLSVFVDAVRLEQVLFLLLNNAFASNPRNEVLIGWNFNIEQNGVEIFVEDSGDGYPESSKGDAFTLFQGSSFGSGLSLNVAKSLVCCMNGDILLHSKLGVGSKFIVFLPVHVSADSIIFASK